MPKNDTRTKKSESLSRDVAAIQLDESASLATPHSSTSHAPEASKDLVDIMWEKQKQSFAHRSAQDILGILTSQALDKPDSSAKKHAFWSTQPVPQQLDALLQMQAKGRKSIESSEERKSIGPIESTQKTVSAEPIALPSADLEWVEFPFEAGKKAIGSAELVRVHDLLQKHYVENFESTFRFHYSEEFLRWALFPPNYVEEWFIGIQEKKGSRLVAFISALPVALRVGAKEFTPPSSIAEINFLCIHKEYRKQRLAEILIKEITRRVNAKGVFQALYTSGSVLPTPFARAQYFHRTLNANKLLRIKFTEIPASFTKFKDPKGMFQRYYALPTKSERLPNYREMQRRDVACVRQLLNHHFRTHFAISPQWTSDADVAHWFLPRDKVIYSYVVEQPAKGKSRPLEITDFFSFYLLPSSVLDGSSEKLNAAYCFYSAPAKASVSELLRCALICANNLGFDVFNALNILDMDAETLAELKFNEGDGFLNYYLFNYHFPTIPSPLIGVVML